MSDHQAWALELEIAALEMRIRALEADLAAQTRLAEVKAHAESAQRHDKQEAIESRERLRAFGEELMLLDLGNTLADAIKTLEWWAGAGAGPALVAARALTEADLELWGERHD